MSTKRIQLSWNSPFVTEAHCQPMFAHSCLGVGCTQGRREKKDLLRLKLERGRRCMQIKVKHYGLFLSATVPQYEKRLCLLRNRDSPVDFLAPSQGREIKYHRAAKEQRSQRGTLADETKRILLVFFLSYGASEYLYLLSFKCSEQEKACVYRKRRMNSVTFCSSVSIRALSF